MRSKTSAMLYAAAAVVWTLPTIVWAAGLIPCDGIHCQFCNLADLVQNIINFAIGISIPIATLLFAYAGIMYATAQGNPGQVSNAHKIFSTAGLGFILAVSGWLIINTILNVLVGNTYGNKDWFNIKCVDQGSRPTAGTLGEMFGGLFQTQGQIPFEVGDVNSPDAEAALKKMVTNPGENSNCTDQNLSSIWGTAAGGMSCIAKQESQCGAKNESTTDVVYNEITGKKDLPVSFGMYQINISANPIQCGVNTIPCPFAFNKPYSSSTKDEVRVINPPLYKACIEYAKNPKCQTITAQEIFKKQGYKAWKNSADKCGISVQ